MEKKKVILLVEDNTDDVDLTIYALRKNEILNELVVARDGVEALEYLFGEDNGNSGNNELPQLILLDLKLPKIDGLEVLRKLRNNEQTRLLPVIVLTSSREEKDVLNSYALGANSYIRKPVDFNKFFGVIKEILNYWLALNVSPEVGKGE